MIYPRAITAYVDPGIVGAGLSVFAGAELIRAAYVENTVGVDDAPPLARRVCMARALVAKLLAWGVPPASIVGVGGEDPQILDSRHQTAKKRKADPNDLLNLTGVTAAFAALVGPPGGLPPEVMRSVDPGAWKGNIDKFAMNARVWSKLTAEERARVERRTTVEPGDKKIGLDHNAIDAVGIGLHFVGRLERVRYFAP